MKVITTKFSTKKNTLIEIQQDLHSSILYLGVNNLNAIRTLAYVVVKNSVFNGDTY